MNIKIGVVWLLLGVGTAFDVAYKKIPFFLIIMGVVSGIIFSVTDGLNGWEIFYALLPGVLLVAAAFATREKIGYGDGLFVLALGLLEGGNSCFADLLTGLILVAFAGIFLLILRKGGKNKAVPFIPFLLISHMLNLAAGV